MVIPLNVVKRETDIPSDILSIFPPDIKEKV